MPPRLDLVVVNWNAGPQLQECLKSVLSSTKTAFSLSSVVVIDNGSSDGSLGKIDELILSPKVIRNDKNLGFAAACNQGAEGSQADYLLFLNPDIRLTPESLDAPIQFMQACQHSNVGICGIQLIDEEGRVRRSCSRFLRPSHFLNQMLGLNRFFPQWFQTNFISEWDHSETRRVDVVTGAFFLVRRTVFEALGGFDERYFVYLEDVDFAEAAHRAGWRCVYLTSVQAYHKGGGCSEQAKSARLCYSLQSRILYGYKHFGWLAATATLLGTMLVEPFSRLAWAAWRRSPREMRDSLQAYRMLWLTLPALFSKIMQSLPNQEIPPQPLKSGAVD